MVLAGNAIHLADDLSSEGTNCADKVSRCGPTRRAPAAYPPEPSSPVPPGPWGLSFSSLSASPSSSRLGGDRPRPITARALSGQAGRPHRRLTCRPTLSRRNHNHLDAYLRCLSFRPITDPPLLNYPSTPNCHLRSWLRRRLDGPDFASYLEWGAEGVGRLRNGHCMSTCIYLFFSSHPVVCRTAEIGLCYLSDDKGHSSGRGMTAYRDAGQSIVLALPLHTHTRSWFMRQKLNPIHDN